ncbi:MAG TPA: tetratricopeptide repeat protein [Nitrospiria bacterium]|jgi:tetratricopeptide (TPR) repeat protein
MKFKHIIFFLGFSCLNLISCGGKDTARFVDSARLESEVKDILINQGLSRRQALLAIRDYEDFLSAYFKTKSDLKAEAMHRLGDLLMEVTLKANREARLIYEDRSNRYREGQLKQKPLSPRFDFSKPIALYERVLTLYPSRPANDRVLYQLARGYLEEGKTHSGLQTLHLLMTRYPSSSYFLEAAFRVGDLRFELGLFQEANQAYQVIVEKGPSPFYQKGLYKIGWSYFKLQDYNRAIQTLGIFLDEKRVGENKDKKMESERPLDRLNDLDWEMIQEVVRVMAVSFDYLGGGPALVQYFKGIGNREYEEMIYRGLGDFYLAGGNPQKAISVYSLFLKQYPFHPHAPSLQWSLIQAYDQEQKIGRATEARIQFVQLFGPESQWVQRNANQRQGLYESRMKDTTYRLALFFHSEAQRVKQKGPLMKAVHWYQSFLSHYPGSKEALEVHFLFAESLFELGRFLEAAKAYEVVAYEYPHHSKSEEAAYAALVAYEQWQTVVLKEESTEAEKILLQNSKKFLERFLNHSKTPEVLLKVINLEYQRGDLSEARKFTRLFLDHSDAEDPMKTQAYQMLGAGYFQEGQYMSAAEAYGSAFRLLQPEHPKRKEFQDLMALSLYQEAERLKAEGNVEEASELFLRISEEIPGAKTAEASLYEGSLLLLQQGKKKKASANLEKLIESPSPYQNQAKRKLAVLYEKMNRPVDAAKLYDQFWKAEQEAGKKTDILFYTAGLYEKGGKWKVAADRFQKAAAQFPVDSKGKIESIFRSAQNLFREGDLQGSQKLYSSVIFLYQGSHSTLDSVSPFVAQSYLILGRGRHEDFLKVQLKHPLEENLKLKENLRVDVLEQYEKAAEFKIKEIVTEVSYRKGKLFEDYGLSIAQSERPSDLKPGELQEYNLLLEKESQQWKEKAVSAYERNVHRAQTVGLYDLWVKKSFERLGILNPQRYQKKEFEESVFRETGF